ncbi:MAG: TonB-dependent siderophore receptor [Lysobacteraceae bacterium]
MTHRLPHPTPLALVCLVVLAGLVSGPTSAAVDTPAGEKEAVDLDTVRVRGQRLNTYRTDRSTSATRTDTPLRDVPQAITVVTEKQMHDQGVQGMADAVRYVPGINTTQGEGNRDGLVFRGNSSTADFFVDGMRDDVQYYRDTYNIERIEAFKGPNAMIFGRGSPGGLLNRVTKTADWRETLILGLQLGSWQKRRATADLAHPFSDAFAFRVTSVHEDSEGFRDGYEVKRRGLNPTAAIRAGDNTLITLGYEYFRDKRTADRGIPSYANAFDGTRVPVATDRRTFFGDPDASHSDTEIDAFSALIEHDFGDGTVLRNRTRVADYDKTYQNVFPGNVDAAATTVALSAYLQDTGRKNLFNQTDLIFSTNTGTLEHKFMTGIEFGRQETDNLRRSGLFVLGAGSPCRNIAGPITCTVPLTAPTVAPAVVYANNSAGGSGDARNTGVTKFAAVYAQDQIEFSPQWSAIVGLRYDRFDVDFTDLRTGVAADRRQLSSADDLWSPRMGVVFKPIEQLSLYASYGVTYLPRSGEQLGALAFNSQSLDSEEFKNTEIGAKWEIRPGLTAEAAVFRLDRSNTAITDPNDSTRLILLAGDSQRVDGVELSMAGNFTERWQIIGSYAWLDARTVRTVGTTPAGRVLAQTPETSIGLWNRYDFNDRWGVALGATYRSESYATISNAVTLKSYARYDAAMYYKFDDRFSAQLNVENLFDKAYYPSAHTDNNITPGAPRSAHVTLNFKF